MPCLPDQIARLARCFLVGICCLSISWGDCFSEQTAQSFIKQMDLAQQTSQQNVLHQRSKIIHLSQQTHWTTQEKNFLVNQLKDHNLPATWPITPKGFKQLLSHADVVPAALLIAQAALESGYGRSRFAKKGCNLFGIWCYQPGCGIVPMKRAKNANYEVKRFKTLQDAITHYYAIVNREETFATFRYKRAELRKHPQPHPSQILALTLQHYATVKNYPDCIILMLKKPNIAQYDVFPPKS